MEQNKKLVEKQAKKRFSIKWKLMITAGLLIFTTGIVVGITSVHEGRLEITRQVKARLVNKAEDTAQLIDARLNGFYKVLETIAANRAFTDDITPFEKLKRVEKYMNARASISDYALADLNGETYANDGHKYQLKDRAWFKQAIQGKRGIQEGLHSAISGEFVMALAVPVYDKNNAVIGVLVANMPGLWLTEQINDIVVGETGECYIENSKGTYVASKNRDRVKARFNIFEEAKKDPSLEPAADFIQKALNSESKSELGFYKFSGVSYIASYCKMKTTGWTVFVKAPQGEFMDGINSTRLKSIIFGIITLVISLIITFLIVSKMVVPIQSTVNSLQDIAEGGGDLTVRLPVKGNDEIRDLSQYFNQTIAKIGNTIQTVKENAGDLNDVGQNLSTNMTETATSVNQISANIEGVKGQVMSQATGVTETSATMEEIIRTIHNLDVGIGNQVESLQNLMQIIDDSNATTEETRNILAKNDELIEALVGESSQGKEVIFSSEQEVQKILEESGSLMEASSIIQNIASQTNLLAMNAAIEAAHAGDAGKGFAVVADEIRKLAEESASQAKVITAALKNLSTEIESVSKSSGNIGESFSSIFEKVNQVKKRSAGIMKIAETRKVQSEKLLALIEKVDNITKEVKDGSAEMLKGGEQVAGEMRKLDDLTRVITDSMNEMASGATQINNAVQEVNDLTQQNTDHIKNLTVEVNKFKV